MASRKEKVLKDIVALILAGGKGTRMKSELPKVLHRILGKPIIRYLVDSIEEAGVADIVSVAGYGSDLLKEELKDTGVKVVVQKKLLGSGDAVKTAKTLIHGKYKDVMVICGDTPLIPSEAIKSLIEKHKDSKASATILTVKVKDPTGYGRIVRSGARIVKIAEEEDARFYEEAIDEINVGTYCFDINDLFEAFSFVKASNDKNEYYLTDVIEIMHKKNRPIESVTANDEDEMIGVNTRSDLARAASTLKKKVIEGAMSEGVTVEDPSSTVIYPGAKIGKDSIIYSNTVIESGAEIGKGCHIGTVARIRGGVLLADNVEIGNFVELVRTKVRSLTKIKHHTYLGDAVVGRRVNIGAGVITANFDGKKKNRTVIEDGAFLGIGVRLIAPVRVGANAVVGAGAVVLSGHDVPRGSTVAGVPSRIIKRR